MAKPMTKTQLVAALADEMGTDKKSASGCSGRHRTGIITKRSVRRRCRDPARRWQDLLPRASRADGAQPRHRRTVQEGRRQGGQDDHRQGAERQRERLNAPIK